MVIALVISNTLTCDPVANLMPQQFVLSPFHLWQASLDVLGQLKVLVLNLELPVDQLLMYAVILDVEEA